MSWLGGVTFTIDFLYTLGQYIVNGAEIVTDFNYFYFWDMCNETKLHFKIHSVSKIDLHNLEKFLMNHGVNVHFSKFFTSCYEM